MLTRTRVQVIAAVTTVVVVAAVIVAFLVFGGGGKAEPEATAPSPTPPATATTPAPDVAPFDAGAPARVKIDKIDVDAPVLAMGIAADGSQAVPTTLTDLSWWRDGSHAGASGNAVITGHAAHLPTDDGVFDNLGKLTTGDEFQVVADKGTVKYRVTGSDEIDTADFGEYADRIYASEGDPGAVLMTCGSWNGQVWETTTVIWATKTSHEK